MIYDITEEIIYEFKAFAEKQRDLNHMDLVECSFSETAKALDSAIGLVEYWTKYYNVCDCLCPCDEPVNLDEILKRAVFILAYNDLYVNYASEDDTRDNKAYQDDAYRFLLNKDLVYVGH